MRRLMRALSGLFLVWGLFCATLSGAQSVGSIDFDAWQRLTTRAEATIDAGRASDNALESLRGELAVFRADFSAARETNSARIRTVQSQLNALGTEPEDGEPPEPSAVATTRTNLEAELETLQAPGLVAEAAFNRANGLISEIDGIMRARQASYFLTRGPVPINPAYWIPAQGDFLDFFQGAVNEVFAALDNPLQVRSLLQSLPLGLVLFAAGLLMVGRGGRLARRLGEHLRGLGGRGSGLWGFVISLARLLIPLIGIFLMTRGIQVLGVLGLRGEAILNAVPYWAAIVLGFNWLGERSLAYQELERDADIAADRRRAVMIVVHLVGLALVFQQAVDLIIAVDQINANGAAVLRLPVVVFGAIALLRVSRVARMSAEMAKDGDEADAPRVISSLQRVMPPLRAVSRILAILAPLAAAAGFMNAAMGTMFPIMWTLALMSTAVIVQAFLSRLYAWVMGSSISSGQDTLFSALIGLALALGCLPLVALIWGMRESDLSELWSRFLDGVVIGGNRVSPLDFLTFIVIFAIGYGLTRLLQGTLKNSLLPKTAIEPGGQTAIVSGLGYVGIFLAGLAAITGAGINLSSLAIVAGALSVGIGFGLQTIVSNFVSGIILLIERPVSEGDWIEVGSYSGIVKNISVRSTRIETFDRSDVIVPNSDLISGTVINYTHTPAGRVIVPVGVAYGTDTRKVDKILREIADDHPMVLANPAPFILFKGFGADSLDFEVRVILRDVNWGLTVRSELNHAIAERFARDGIEIPFAQRDVWLRNPEALVTGGTGGAAPAVKKDDHDQN